MYTSKVPCDIDAVVTANTRLSDDYNVLALAAPEIAGLARPGQFVMVKASPSADPLLRRPFSVFEILRNADGTPAGISILNKRIGTGTRLLYDLEPGARVMCLGPLGQPFEPVEPPMHAWMVAGGVGLAPFLTLAEALAARGTPATLFYGERLHHGAARSGALRPRSGAGRPVVCLRSNADDARGRSNRSIVPPALRRLAGASHGMWTWWLLQLCSADA